MIITDERGEAHLLLQVLLLGLKPVHTFGVESLHRGVPVHTAAQRRNLPSEQYHAFSQQGGQDILMEKSK